MNKRARLIFLLIILTIFALLIGGSFPYFLLFIFISIIIFTMMSIKKVEGDLLGVYWSSSDVIQKGERITVDYKIYNSGFLPLSYLEIKDGIPEKLSNDGGEESVYFMLPFDAICFTREIECNRRGLYQLGSIKVITGDIFGMIRKEFFVKDNLPLIVYPKVYSLDRFNIFGKEFFGSVSTTQKFYEDYSSIKDIRKYEVGDSIKRINWKVSARMGDLYVKNYDISANVEIQLFMDFQLEKYREDLNGDIEEKIVECAISIINMSLYRNIDIDFVTYTDRKVQLHGKNPGKFKEFLETMVRISPVKNVNLGDVIINESRILSLGTTIIIITPEIDKKIASSIITLKKTGYSIITIIVSDFQHNKHLSEEIILLEKMDIRVYKIGLQDNISQVLR